MIDDITVVLVFINPGLSTGIQIASHFPESNNNQGLVNM